MPDNPARDAMSLAIAHLQSTAAVKPMNKLEEAIFAGRPNVQAVTWPWNRVAYRPTAVTADQPSTDDLLAHELTHVDQHNRQGLIHTLMALFKAPNTYSDRPYEQEAFAVESRRQAARTDRVLPKDAK